MHGWSRWALLGCVALVATLTVRSHHAASDNCVHVCAETDKDDRGCCPAAKPKVQPKVAPVTPKVQPNVQPKSSTQLDIRGDANLAGARVKVDDQLRGVAPTVIETTPGRHLVELSKDNFEPHQEWVEVAAGQHKTVAVTLTPRPAAAVTPTNPPPKTSTGSCPAGMVHVPAGTFTMGSDYSAERPAHPVTLGGYCLDATEVTVAAYGKCVAAGTCTATTEPAKKGVDDLCNGTRSDRQSHPVNCVDWNQAKAFCAWASKRLPTEAEWEHAARGDDGRTYPWGNDAPSKRRLNACGSECVAMIKRLRFREVSPMYPDDDGWEATAPVGSFPAGASPFGALDMAGNVGEWIADLYGPYTANATTNPTGTTTGYLRIDRGGTWSNFTELQVRGANRDMTGSTSRAEEIGFRCARLSP